MNPGLVVKLRPSGPWRIGPDSGARNRVDFIYHSDSLYSAVTSAMARLGSLEAWLDATARRVEGSLPPEVCFSSCFPFLDEIGFVVPPRTVWPPVSRALVSARVRWKSARFVPIGVVQAVLAGQRLDDNHWSVDGASECLVPAGRPGPFRTAVRWSAAVDRLTGATERHSTACLEFRPGAGLWTVVSFAGETAHAQWLEPVKAAFRLLADTGFGGERSRGWGRAEAPEFIEGILPDMILPAVAKPVTSVPGEETPSSLPKPAPAEEAAAAAIATEEPEPAPVTEPPHELPPIEEPEPAERTEGMAAVRASSVIEPLEINPEPVSPADDETVTPHTEPESGTLEKAAAIEVVPPVSAEPDAVAPTAAPSVEAGPAATSPATAAEAEPAPPTAATPAGAELAPPTAATPAGAELAPPTPAPSAETELAAPPPATPAEAEPAATSPAHSAEAELASPTAAPSAEAELAPPTQAPSLEAELAPPTPAPSAEAVALMAATSAEAELAPPTPATSAEAELAPPTAAPSAEAEPAPPTPAPSAEAEPAPPSPAPSAEAEPSPEPPATVAEPVPQPAEPSAPGPRPSVPEAHVTPSPQPSAPVFPYWLLSLFTPAPTDAVDWRRGNYAVLPRGGRVDSPAGSGELKKQVQMIAEGSVVYAPTGPSGAAADVAPDGFAHPVFRAGFAVSIPLPEVS